LNPGTELTTASDSAAEIARKLEDARAQARKVALAGWILAILVAVANALPFAGFAMDTIMSWLTWQALYYILIGAALGMISWPAWSPGFRRLARQAAEVRDIRSTGDIIDAVVQAVGTRARTRLSEVLSELLPRVDDLAYGGITEERLSSLQRITRTNERFSTSLRVDVMRWAERRRDLRFLPDVKRATKSKDFIVAAAAKGVLAVLEEEERNRKSLASLLRPAGFSDSDVLLKPAASAAGSAELLQAADPPRAGSTLSPRGEVQAADEE
jgi:hypothetical protein